MIADPAKKFFTDITGIIWPDLFPNRMKNIGNMR
jgi:hypothetical protein